MTWWDNVWPILAALIPSAGLLLLFLFILKHIVEADRRERAAQRRWEAEQEQADDRSNGKPGAET